MKIGIIGYRGHASRHIGILKNVSNTELIIYHPKKDLNQITNCFDDIICSDCVIISSPTPTHFSYIKDLVDNNYKGKVYLEKPGFASIKESYELEDLQYSSKLDITIGYHFPFEEKIKFLKSYISQSELGEIISFDIVMSKGIAYKKDFNKDWRSKDKRAVCHTGLSHALSIFYFLCSENLNKDIDCMVFYNKENGTYDNALAVSNLEKPLFKAIFSWGAPFVGTKIEILTTNSLILLHGNQLEIRSPRDTFDSENRFKTPEIFLTKTFLSKGIKPSILDFINKVKSPSKFNSLSFKQSLKIGRECLKAKIIE